MSRADKHRVIRIIQHCKIVRAVPKGYGNDLFMKLYVPGQDFFHSLGFIIVSIQMVKPSSDGDLKPPLFCGFEQGVRIKGSRFFIINGSNNSSAIFLGRPH